MPDQLAKIIRDVPDFPKPGILFKDITTLLSDPVSLRRSIDLFSERAESAKPGKIIGIDSRGFIFGAAVAANLGVGFIPARKKGKLPYKTVSAEYALEYGTDTVEMHEDAVAKGERVVIIDDLLATGGTAEAVTKLVTQLGGEIVEIDFLIELTFLNGRDKLKPYNIHSIIQYD